MRQVLIFALSLSSCSMILGSVRSNSRSQLSAPLFPFSRSQTRSINLHPKLIRSGRLRVSEPGTGTVHHFKHEGFTPQSIRTGCEGLKDDEGKIRQIQFYIIDGSGGKKIILPGALLPVDFPGGVVYGQGDEEKQIRRRRSFVNYDEMCFPKECGAGVCGVVVGPVKQDVDFKESEGPGTPTPSHATIMTEDDADSETGQVPVEGTDSDFAKPTLEFVYPPAKEIVTIPLAVPPRPPPSSATEPRQFIIIISSPPSTTAPPPISTPATVTTTTTVAPPTTTPVPHTTVAPPTTTIAPPTTTPAPHTTVAPPTTTPAPHTTETPSSTRPPVQNTTTEVHPSGGHPSPPSPPAGCPSVVQAPPPTQCPSMCPITPSCPSPAPTPSTYCQPQPPSTYCCPSAVQIPTAAPTCIPTPAPARTTHRICQNYS